jgi:hypothetical protein
LLWRLAARAAGEIGIGLSRWGGDRLFFGKDARCHEAADWYGVAEAAFGSVPRPLRLPLASTKMPENPPRTGRLTSSIFRSILVCSSSVKK